MSEGFHPIPATEAELLAVIDDIRARVADGDSFEGFLNYLIPEPGTDADFMVEARYRVGNKEHGQGFMRMVGEMR